MTQTPTPSSGASLNDPFSAVPPAPQGLGAHGPKSGAVGWWVAAGVAVLVIVVLVVMLLQGSRQPVVVTPTPPASESTVADLEDLAEFTPTYELRELSRLTFPETFEGYAVVSDYTGSIERSANYEEVDGPGVFAAQVTSSPSEFAFRVKYFADPVLIGDAVCGAMSDDGVSKECVMAGIEGPLTVSTAGQFMTLEELARIIQALYAFQ